MGRSLGQRSGSALRFFLAAGNPAARPGLLGPQPDRRYRQGFARRESRSEGRSPGPRHYHANQLEETVGLQKGAGLERLADPVNQEERYRAIRLLGVGLPLLADQRLP